MDTADGRAFADKSSHFVGGQDDGAVLFRIEHIGRGQAERVNGAVRHFDRADQLRIYRRLNNPRLLRIDCFCTNPCFFAGADKGGLEGKFILRQGNKQTVRWLNAVAGDTFQNLVFADAFTGRFRVSHGIARTAVQQPMVTAGCTGRNIMTFD